MVPKASSETVDDTIVASTEKLDFSDVPVVELDLTVATGREPTDELSKEETNETLFSSNSMVSSESFDDTIVAVTEKLDYGDMPLVEGLTVEEGREPTVELSKEETNETLFSSKEKMVSMVPSDPSDNTIVASTEKPDSSDLPLVGVDLTAEEGQEPTVELSKEETNERNHAHNHCIPPISASTSTKLVVRTESMKMLWNVLRRTIKSNKIVQFIAKYNKRRQNSTSKSSSARSWRDMFRRKQTSQPKEAQTNDDTNEPSTPSKTRRWNFLVNWSKRNGQKSNATSENVEKSEVLLKYEQAYRKAMKNTSEAVSAGYKTMKKASVAVCGGCMVVVGVPLLIFPVPGPGVAMISGGVYVISSEFEFAQRWLKHFQNRVKYMRKQLGNRSGDPANPPSPPKLDNDGFKSTKVMGNDDDDDDQKRCIIVAV